MKLRMCAVAMLASAWLWPLPVSAKGQAEELRVHLRDPGGPVMVAAHRACWKDTSENSLSAIEACIKKGVDIVEIDVRRTVDGQLVLMHDSTIDRTTSGKGKVSELTLRQVTQTRLAPRDGRSGEGFTKEHPPTLEQALRAAKGHILVNLDMKDASVAGQSLALARQMGVEREIIFKSPRYGDTGLEAVARFYPDAAFFGLMEMCRDAKADRKACFDLPPDPSRFEGFQPIGYELVYTDLKFLDAVKTSKVRGDRRIWVNALGPRYAAGVDDEHALSDPDGNWGALVDAGVSIIQTDEPARLREYLEAKQRR